MGITKKNGQAGIQPNNKSFTGKEEAIHPERDDRETIGVDDKLIGDDLDIELAERCDDQEITRPVNNDNIY